MDDKIKIVVEEVKDVPVEEEPKIVNIPVETVLAPEKKKVKINKGVVLFVFFAILLLTLLAGGLIVSRESLNQKEATSKKSVITVLSPVPTEAEPTPTPTINISILKISILNGSGVSGKAGEVKKYLEGLGYENITTGNAKNYDYKNITLSIKSDKNEFLDRLKTDIAKKYTLNEKSPAVETSNASDVVIIIGK